MANLLFRIAIILVPLVAVLYQFVFKALLFDGLGYGRSVSSIDKFDVTCQRIHGHGLEGCEDMWLHAATGLLFMACSASHGRVHWTPSLGRLNAPERPLTDRVGVLDTRRTGDIASRLKWLSVENFSGTNGDGALNLHGFDVRADPTSSDTLQLLLVNHRPPVDPTTGAPLDATSVGLNSTVELFETKLGSSTMRYIKTYSDPAIDTPNRVAWVGEDAFVFTNDHSAKTGFRRAFDIILGCGSVGYCDDKNGCHVAQASGFNVPNGLVRGQDGLIYVPSSVMGEIQIFSLTTTTTPPHLNKVDSIQVPYPIDNLSVDEEGDIYAAAFPQTYKFLRSADNPSEVNPPSAVFRIRKVTKPKDAETSEASSDGAGQKGYSYDVQMIMEDTGTVLPGATTAVHDTRTGRIFLGGNFSPFITICETR